MGEGFKRKLSIRQVRIPLNCLLIVVQCLFFSSPVEASSRSNKAKIREIHSGIEKIVQSVDPHVHIGIEVVSLKTGRSLYAKNTGHLFMPASNLKLITGAAALQILGADYRFQTKLYTDAPIKDGILQGSLWIKGSGDPELSTRSLEELVSQLKSKGIQKIEGSLYVDRCDFDGIAQGPGWTWDDGAVVWNSPMDALTINHSCVDVWVEPNKSSDLPPHVYVQPNTDFVTIENLGMTSLEDHDLSVERSWMARENSIQIKGSIALSKNIQKFMIPVESPHLYAAHVLRNLLAKNQILFEGEIQEKAVTAQAVELASYASRPLREIVIAMMKISDNLIADCLFKKIGQQTFGAPGSWQSGTRAVKNFLTNTVGMDVSNMVIVDGSGMSRYNLLSPHQFIQFLTWADNQFPISLEFATSLPIAGVDGCLRNRMTDPAVKGRVLAKTGSLMGVSTLSGYAMTKAGEKLVFSIMISGFTKESSEYKVQIEDQILQYIVNQK